MFPRDISPQVLSPFIPLFSVENVVPKIRKTIKNSNETPPFFIVKRQLARQIEMIQMENNLIQLQLSFQKL